MDTPRPTLAAIRRALRARACAADARALQWFFKTGPGEYGEGDVFIGVKVPGIRAVARQYRAMPLRTVSALLASRIHEERLLALLGLVDQFQRTDPARRGGLYRFYLAHTARINNWDLVDLSAPGIVGGWLFDRPRAQLDRLARSRSLWERRIAIVATLTFIRAGQFGDTLRIADRLATDPHDLIHKATGWMLREVGKRDQAVLEAYLRPRCRTLPRTTLRYAIERFPEPLRQKYLRGTLPG